MMQDLVKMLAFSQLWEPFRETTHPVSPGLRALRGPRTSHAKTGQVPGKPRATAGFGAEL